MGFYILDSHEVGTQGKLELLERIPGVVPLDDSPSSAELPKRAGMYAVCWVDNGTFEAVAIAYDNKELERFLTGMNGRLHGWFLVPTEELVKLKPHLAEYFRGEKSWRT